MSGRKKGRTAAKGRLRIIGGQWRGRRLPVPDGPGLRPTPDRVRETLFNWLQADIAGLRCLDLFAGSGALGFEALSRGAGELTLLETHPAARRSLQESSRLLGITPRLPTADALQFLARDVGHYDLVFVDPPFAAGLWGAVLTALPPRLAAGHRVYLESPVSTEVLLPPGWVVHKEGRAADVAFRLLAYAPEFIESEQQNNGDPPPGRNE